MAKCNFDELLKKVGVDKLTKQVEVDFSIHKDLPDCRKINTKKIVAASDDFTYNKNRKPVNRFECMRKGCVNSGTLFMAVVDETVSFKAQYDGVEYAGGAVTFYVDVTGNSTWPVALTFKISAADTFADSDVYTVSITEDMVTADNFVPVIIDLSAAPASVEGAGWVPGAVSYIQLSADQIVGYSSISIFDSIEDFETNDVVKVGCLSQIGGSFDVAAIEATCLSAGYNDDISSFTYTVEGNTVTPNYWKLNPLMGKGSATEGFEIVTVEKTAEAGVDNAFVTLSDVYQDECGFTTVQVADSCDTTEATLVQLSIPTPTDLDENQYQIIKNDDGTTDFFFHESLAGTKLLISYPRAAEIDEEIASINNIGSVRVRMSLPMTTTDGTKYVLIFDNVLVTSFPATINTSETVFSFTITIQRDDTGVFFRKHRIVA